VGAKEALALSTPAIAVLGLQGADAVSESPGELGRFEVLEAGRDLDAEGRGLGQGAGLEERGRRGTGGWLGSSRPAWPAPTAAGRG
jgi:hypothetical protein